MTKLKMTAVEFKKMNNPWDSDSDQKKYVCYVQANTIPTTINDWFGTNPREQKMSTDVARAIKRSLEENSNFHELNRGILISAKSVDWDNKTRDLEIELDSPDIHGNIDGGHTLRAILEAQNNNVLPNDRFVFVEVFTGVKNTVDLAEARNTAVQVDRKSIEKLKKSFEVIKESLSKLNFSDRIQYKMNEFYGNEEKTNLIDVREVLAILIMFSKEIYNYKKSDGTLSSSYPIQCYSGKEASLRKFLTFANKTEEENKNAREKMIQRMAPIIKDIFNLWETIEVGFVKKSSECGKRYGTRKYSKYDNGNRVGGSFFYGSDLQYVVPKGLMYPIVGAFRALVEIDNNGFYKWKKNPIDVWNSIGQRLVDLVLEEKIDNPDVLAKNQNLWSNLLKEVYISGHME